ncbi:deoxyxylulose-5-phosphate synthase [Streptomyces sp. SP18CS02]|nr:deoxyxylulose-5-phosphate synthase [Streptomyces sp. SP18CS02]
MPPARSHFICLPCRASCKKVPDHGRGPEHLCPRCRGPLLDAGSALAVPPRRDTAGWRALTAVLHAGLRFHQGCGGGPGHRPRTPREVRERLEHAARAGLAPARALTLREPVEEDVRRRAGRGGCGPRHEVTRSARGRAR